ncbi:hypothetical protein [Rhodococcus sp. 11-3]|uniref:hypothetical protein n=1 Tax=Rhodococcus sp. 11-3 TaxID=2854796 RepID=UPI002041BCB5|nr:hypothetical protein [Rhodococcus sp. 11-3]USC18461.1 hypothetical protein KZJ41_28200 [Rhodococcus sp. 11-3]
MTPDDDGRPRWSASEAAKRCGVSRSTIQRAIAAGKITNVEQTPEGWSIPLSALLAAGFTPDRPSPPDPAPDHARVDTEHVRAADQLAAELREARTALAEARAEAEREQVRRAAAEALAAERDRIIDAQAQALRMLESGRSPAPAWSPGGITPAPVTDPSPPAPGRRGLVERIAGRLGI